MSDTNEPKPDATAVQTLCARAAGGNADALAQLLSLHHGRLASLVRRKIGVDWQGKLDPDDVLQEAYLAIFAGFRDFTCRDEDSFYHWAARIVDHKFIDQARRWRSKQRDVSREVAPRGGSLSRHESFLERCLPDLQTPSATLRREEAVGALMSCIARLPDDHRTVVQRFHLNGEPLATLAADLGRSEDAVRRLATRALDRLRACLRHASRYLSTHA